MHVCNKRNQKDKIVFLLFVFLELTFKVEVVVSLFGSVSEVQ